ncbi:MAG: hypothetical protein FWD17_06325 [Polyangiaceae bacterium]|nr:hypothetical protein [Polyangiaceae bacterium]
MDVPVDDVDVVVVDADVPAIDVDGLVEPAGVEPVAIAPGPVVEPFPAHPTRAADKRGSTRSPVETSIRIDIASTVPRAWGRRRPGRPE